MKVILTQDIKKIGRKGEIKNVSDGYARNFLIPKNMVVLATDSALKELKETERIKEEQAEQDLLKYEDMASRLDGLEFEIPAKASEDGKLYGAINNQKIAEFLSAQGFEINKNEVKLEEPIKETGDYEIQMELPHGLEAKIKIIVVPENIKE